MTYFFTGDLHLGHANIIRHCKRPFSCVDEMDDTLIDNWNDKVRSSNDTVFVLGDMVKSKLPAQICESYFRRLRGRKFLIKGNHDKGAILKMPWGWVKDVFFLRDLNQEGIWLSHYAHRVWRNSIHGSWHIFAHSHGGLSPLGRSFDAGVDANNYQLLALEEVENIIEQLNQSFLEFRRRNSERTTFSSVIDLILRAQNERKK